MVVVVKTHLFVVSDHRTVCVMPHTHTHTQPTLDAKLKEYLF